MWRNTNTAYGCVSKFFHWTIFLLVFCMIVGGFIMTSLSNRALASQIIGIHKAIGLLILMLMVLRILWTLTSKKPALADDYPAMATKLARIMHLLLYITVFLMPICGILLSSYAGYPIHFFGLFKFILPVAKDKALAGFFSDCHTVLAWVIAILVVLHAGAALSHHYLLKDDILKRMLPSCCCKNKDEQSSAS